MSNPPDAPDTGIPPQRQMTAEEGEAYKEFRMTNSKKISAPFDSGELERAHETMSSEMIAQARLGHKRFCVGTHEHEGGELEYEWIDWSEAFARLSSLRSSSLGEPGT